MIFNVLCANDGLEEFETPGRPGEARAKPMEDGPSIDEEKIKKKAKNRVRFVGVVRGVVASTWGVGWVLWAGSVVWSDRLEARGGRVGNFKVGFGLGLKVYLPLLAICASRALSISFLSLSRALAEPGVTFSLSTSVAVPGV